MFHLCLPNWLWTFVIVPLTDILCLTCLLSYPECNSFVIFQLTGILCLTRCFVYVQIVNCFCNLLTDWYFKANWSCFDYIRIVSYLCCLLTDWNRMVSLVVLFMSRLCIVFVIFLLTNILCLRNNSWKPYVYIVFTTDRP